MDLICEDEQKARLFTRADTVRIVLVCWLVGGHLGEEAESCRVHVQVRVPIQRRRVGHAGTTTGDNCVSSVGRARALLELVLPLFNVNSPAGPNGQSQLETRVITWVKSKSRLFPVFSNRTSCVCAKLIWLPRHIYHRFCGPVTMCCVVVDDPVGHTSVHSDRGPRAGGSGECARLCFTAAAALIGLFTRSSRPVHGMFPP